MAKDKKLVEGITSMDVDFAQWYTDVVKKAELCDYTSVKGCMVIKPAGYAMVSLKFETEVGGLAAWIEELFVEEEFRSKGIGRSFFRFLADEFKGKIKRIRLEVGDENDGAKKLAFFRKSHQKQGFQRSASVKTANGKPV